MQTFLRIAQQRYEAASRLLEAVPPDIALQSDCASDLCFVVPARSPDGPSVEIEVRSDLRAEVFFRMSYLVEKGRCAWYAVDEIDWPRVRAWISGRGC